ncbi:uncharacterized protein F5147DRAFT_712935 [Suillus discolor]|uniref:Uncharacterized protein n=1 Tax=Suillus discolor TaxID=1912936 RepID=A0A9P7F0W7_9AGAM|nr:uncharacterized protein F5147DRAFT_712935 [Suillus discolor]KAG2098956.1 hypothetical protein F5147DRAFT_712935 [Suillus discolor]
MPSSTHHAQDSTILQTSCTKYFMERGDGMQKRILENHFAGYDASGDIHDTTTGVRPPISPPQHVVPQRCPSPDPLLSDPNNSMRTSVSLWRIYTHVKRHSNMFVLWTQTASLDDEDTGLSAETVARLKFPLQFMPSLEGDHHCRRQALPSTFSFRQGCAR